MKLNEQDVAAIGSVSQSSYKDKWGTPRQGALTPESVAVVTLEKMPVDPPSGRVAVLWYAHLNSSSFNPLKALIKPPKRPDAKVGVFATRGVHRPSPIGLSFCNVVSVEGLAVTLSGADMIEGTPVLAITRCDMLPPISTVTMPEWTRIAETRICWSLASLMSVQRLSRERNVRAESMVGLVEGVLKQDPRSVHSIKKHVNPVYEVELGDDPIWVIYRHSTDGTIEVVFVSETRIVDSARSRTQEWLDRLVEKVPFIR